MYDPHDAIRRLYGEPGAEPPPSETPGDPAEVRAMADMKEALDRLPPRRPDASVVDAVVAAAAESARETALDSVRAAYGEIPMPEDADAETRAFAAMKTALDALPPQRPDASLIDAVVGAAGALPTEASLAAIRAVYDEEAPALTSTEAHAEAAALAPIKAALDELPSRRPDAAVIDAVMAAAAGSLPAASVAATAGRAADRPAHASGVTTRRRIASALGTVFALVIVLGGGFWLMQDTPPSEIAAADQQAERAMAERETAPASEPTPPSGAEPSPVAADQIAAGQVAAGQIAADQVASGRSAVGDAQDEEVALPPARTQASPSSAPSAAAPASDLVAASAERQAAATNEAPAEPEAQAFAASALADGAVDDLTLAEAEALAREDDDALRLLYLRLRELQASQAGLGWDDSPVALGAAPDSADQTTAPSGWMQVRVDR